MSLDNIKHHQNNIKSNHGYRFYRYTDVETKWLTTTDRVLEPGTLCWVLRGRKAKRKKKKTSTTNVSATDKEDEIAAPQRKVLFNRAIVEHDSNQCDDDDRVLVRYPAGATYRVRRVNLLPVLQEHHVVICLTETLMYRRWAVVHTQANDRFCEIGCDVGILVHRVWEHHQNNNVVGLDTCRASIVEAQRRYPHCRFRQWKVPLSTSSDNNPEKSGEENNFMKETNKDGDDKQQQSPSAPQKSPLPHDLFQSDTLDIQEDDDKDCSTNTNSNVSKHDNLQTCTNNNLVVAIDINGNRELPVVQQCIQIVIQEWKPRLIIVKSETLFQELGKPSASS